MQIVRELIAISLHVYECFRNIRFLRTFFGMLVMMKNHIVSANVFEQFKLRQH